MKTATKVNSTPALGRHGRPPALFTVNVTNMTDVEAKEALDVLEISEWTTAYESVNLSLNKKRHWDTLDFLKREIEQQQFKEKFHVHVVERVWMNRRANCDEITSNADLKSNYGSSIYFEPDTRLYQPKQKEKHERSIVRFGRKDIRKTAKKNSQVKKKKEPKVDEVVEESAETRHPELRVEVVVPMENRVPGPPVTSRRRRDRKQQYKETVASRVSPYYKAKALDDWSRHPVDDWGNDTSDWGVPVKKPNEKKRPKPKIVQAPPKPALPSLVQLESFLDLTFDLQEDEEEEENLTTCDGYIKASAPSFEDFMFSSSKKKKDKRRKSKKLEPVHFSNKGKLVYKPKPREESPESSPEEPETDSTTPETFEMDVKLQKEEISVETLTQLFGERYIECECHPRRFLLDFTASIRASPNWLHWPAVYSYRRSKRNFMFRTMLKKVHQDVKTAGYLVLEEKSDGRFSLGLETDANLDVRMLKTRLPVTDVSPKLITETLSEMLLDNSERKVTAKYADIQEKRSGRAFNILRSMLNWPEADSYYPRPFPEVSNVPEKKQPLIEELDVPKCCNICFAEIDMTSSDSRGLALNKCGHWFCIGCWKNHVITRVKNGSTKIMCPEFECMVRVDEGTLTSLLTFDDLRMYRARIDDITIGTSESKLYCPRPGCERIVLLLEESRETGCVKCKCGAEFCIKCRGHAHWPADCCHFRRYQENQRRFGDEDVMSWDLSTEARTRGKRCPSCNYFIEKNQGCPMMVCVCGHAFCWQCMSPSNDHKFSPDCYAKSDNHGTKNIQEVFIEDLKAHPQLRSKAYMTSLTHRHEQSCRQREVFERFVPKMKKKLKALAGRQMLLNSRGISPTNQKTTRQRREVMCRLLDEVKTREGMHLLDWGVALISEMHHVIEYSAVLVDIYQEDDRIGNTGSLASTLGFLVNRMEEIYLLGIKQDMSSVPIKLMKHANKALDVLSRLQALTKYYPKDLDE